MRIINWIKQEHKKFKTFQANEKAHRKAITAYEKKHGKYAVHNLPRGSPIPKKYYPKTRKRR